jgi:quinol monooxygenase YgiN
MLARLSVCALVLSVLVPSAFGAEEKPHPIAAQVKAAVKDPAKPFVMLVFFKVKEGSEKDFEAAFAPAIEATLKEKGCRAYHMSRDPKSPTAYLLYEHWDSLPALAAHLKTPHIAAVGGKLGELTAGPTEVRVMEPIGK